MSLVSSAEQRRGDVRLQRLKPSSTWSRVSYPAGSTGREPTIETLIHILYIRVVLPVREPRRQEEEHQRAAWIPSERRTRRDSRIYFCYYNTCLGDRPKLRRRDRLRQIILRNRPDNLFQWYKIAIPCAVAAREKREWTTHPGHADYLFRRRERETRCNRREETGVLTRATVFQARRSRKKPD